MRQVYGSLQLEGALYVHWGPGKNVSFRIEHQRWQFECVVVFIGLDSKANSVGGRRDRSQTDRTVWRGDGGR
jgi:hypothetical protein